MAEKFYVANSPSPWDSSDYWSLSSGGLAGAPIPGPDDTAIFDASSSGCFLDTTVNVSSLLLKSGFQETLSQNNYSINIKSDACFSGGWFNGGTAPITIDTIVINNSRFVSTDATLRVDTQFDIRNPLPEYNSIISENITITAEDTTRKYIGLLYPPDNTSNIAVTFGVPQTYGDDYYADGILLKWDGKDLDGTLAAGDTLNITYSVQSAGSYDHNRGTFTMPYSNNKLAGNGALFYNAALLQNADNTRFVRIDGDSSVANKLILEPGFLRGNDSTLSVSGDLHIEEGFGVKGEGHQIEILMDGSRKQNIFNRKNTLLPSFGVDKTTSSHVYVLGSSPLLIDGNLSIYDGTFNTNGRDVKVGIV